MKFLELLTVLAKFMVAVVQLLEAALRFVS
ncbi:hypothetical protein HMPREF0864_04785 [Enterobacteriaceae bacterium 9_2_54FAA]|nr:hypothetical protein HMPREF0864_04785 [Enterobacteriaceae bacterium 9_2_54FAA]